MVCVLVACSDLIFLIGRKSFKTLAPEFDDIEHFGDPIWEDMNMSCMSFALVI